MYMVLLGLPPILLYSSITVVTALDVIRWYFLLTSVFIMEHYMGMVGWCEGVV